MDSASVLGSKVSGTAATSHWDGSTAPMPQELPNSHIFAVAAFRSIDPWITFVYSPHDEEEDDEEEDEEERAAGKDASIDAAAGSGRTSGSGDSPNGAGMPASPLGSDGDEWSDAPRPFCCFFCLRCMLLECGSSQS